MRPNEVSCILYILTVHIPIYRLHNVFFFFLILLWWQLCIPKPASFWWIHKKVAFWRKWSFFMSLVMFLYSCTFILPHTFLSLAINWAYSIRQQAVRISVFIKHWWWSSQAFQLFYIFRQLLTVYTNKAVLNKLKSASCVARLDQIMNLLPVLERNRL